MLITMFQQNLFHGPSEETLSRLFQFQHQTSISALFMNMPAIVPRPPDCSINQST